MDILGSPEQQMLRSSAISAHRKYPDRVAKFVEEAKENNSALIDDFAQRRKANEAANRRFAAAGMGGDVYAAIPRFYHPEDWFKQTQIPYDVKNDKHRFELYRWLDFFYKTHWLIPMLVDIFTRFPLVGIELVSPDKQLKDFYEDLFFDRLDYEQFFVDLGREYWTFGQSFPLGHFNETLGVWEEEELVDPSVVKVRNFPIIGGKQFFVTPSKELIDIAKKQHPKDMFYNLEKYFPHILPYLLKEQDMPISDVLLKQVAFKASPRDLYGTPLLLRSLRTLMHEEKLMAMQDAIAERGYSPLLLFKLGTNDMGPNRPPFIPGPGEIQALRNDLDIAFSSDFRVLVHHFAIEAQSVYGREQMPRLGDDFDRIERRIMQTFGINPNLLAGGAASAPYASSALQAEFLSQILRTFQHFLIKHYVQRAKIVAEAQEHYAYEKRGDTRVPITEEVLVKDPETGEQRIVKKKKLMIPEMRMKVLDLRDEATQRNFLQALKQQGVPIPDQDVAMGMHYVFDEALDKVQEEMIQKTVAQQEAKVKTYRILKAKNLPIPPDLQQEIEGAGIQPPAPGEATDVSVNAPGAGESIVMPDEPGGGPTPGIGPEGPGLPGRDDQPQVSQERMPGIGLRGPQLPGVPGQPGVGGIPGAPSPAVQPPPQGSPGAPGQTRSSEEDAEPILERTLPRNKAKHVPEKLHRAENSATLSEDEQENEEQDTVE
jgi:hypothetical protein